MVGVGKFYLSVKKVIEDLIEFSSFHSVISLLKLKLPSQSIRCLFFIYFFLFIVFMGSSSYLSLF